jgi:putative transposase
MYMPSRNIIKEYAPENYYHVYSRGLNKDRIFLDDKDFEVFISLFKRYLSKDPQKSETRKLYPSFAKEIKLLAYCLMPNHIHMMIYQRDKDAMAKFMRSVMTSYSMYFNKKYNHIGPVFQSRYKASRIDDDSYFTHISRYIHLNPDNWYSYPYSSLLHIRGTLPSWLNPADYMCDFKDTAEYISFLEDYEETKEELEELKWLLANDTEE